ncbi:hypothetical protein ACXM1Z_09905 [Staphylococcus capitis]
MSLNFLILIPIKMFNIGHKLNYENLDNYEAKILIKNSKNKIVDDYFVRDLIYYFKVAFEGANLVLALYIIGLSISSSLNEIYINAVNLAWGIAFVTPLITLKLYEQRFKSLKENEERKENHNK